MEGLVYPPRGDYSDDANDRCHHDAKLILEALIRGELPLSFTSDHVLNEILTILKARRLEPGGVADVINRIMLSPKVQIVFVDEAVFRESLSFYVKYENLRFMDAVSLSIMRRHRVKEIHSHDLNFDKVDWVVRRERL